MAITASTGALLFVERRRLKWRAGTPIPPRSGRLRFRSPQDDDEVLQLMTEVIVGVLTRTPFLTSSRCRRPTRHASISTARSPRRSARGRTGESRR